MTVGEARALRVRKVGARVVLAMRIGARLRQCREARGWSLTDASKASGIRPESISKTELGRLLPSVFTLAIYEAIYPELDFGLLSRAFVGEVRS